MIRRSSRSARSIASREPGGVLVHVFPPADHQLGEEAHSGRFQEPHGAPPPRHAAHAEPPALRPTPAGDQLGHAPHDAERLGDVVRRAHREDRHRYPPSREGERDRFHAAVAAGGYDQLPRVLQPPLEVPPVGEQARLVPDRLELLDQVPSGVLLSPAVVL